ncbi:hypothetical protein VTN77DRAFT_5100 [Rasamsonia byssochlamydoides]|uniref:uncharacterized protein n=1 Tax=Rasamsonia byssochlamydoides TaxID=89139 RepID=UPI003743F5C4
MSSKPDNNTSQDTPKLNDFGSNRWIRDPASQKRRSASGRGMFSGLQDVKHYNVDHGWAKRDVDHRPGFLESLWNSITGSSF